MRDLLIRDVDVELVLQHPLAHRVVAYAESRSDTLVTVDEPFLRKLTGTPHAIRGTHLSNRDR